MRKTVAMFIDFLRDLRLMREAEALKYFGYSVTIYTTEDKQFPVEEQQNGIIIYRIIPSAFFRLRNRSVKKELLDKILQHQYDIIHCHDQYMLQLGVDYKRSLINTILIYDSHELFYEWPLIYDNHDSMLVRIKSILARKYQIYLEKQNIQLTDYIITVNDSVAKLLKKHFNLNELPLVLFNTPDMEEVPEDRKSIRKELNISDSTRLIVYFGSHLYKKKLGIEKPIKEFANQKDIALLFISGDDFAKEYYTNFVKKNGIKNIFFKKFISRKEIVSVLSCCDVGLVTTWDKKHLSYWYALDSKIFSYIMSELPILSTAQPEYSKIIEQNDIGICINPGERGVFMKGLEIILNKYDYYRNNVNVAKQKFNWEKEKIKLAELYNKIEMDYVK
jgi:glycosyltransferase involved in cell wall biosynthesis